MTATRLCKHSLYFMHWPGGYKLLKNSETRHQRASNLKKSTLAALVRVIQQA